MTSELKIAWVKEHCQVVWKCIVPFWILNLAFVVQAALKNTPKKPQNTHMHSYIYIYVYAQYLHAETLLL